MNSPETSQPQTDLMATLIHAIAALLARVKFLAVSTICVGALAAFLIVQMPETFTSSATVIVSENTSPKSGALSMLKESGLGSLLGGIKGESSNMPVLQLLLETRELALWGVKKYKLDSVWTDGDTTPMRPEVKIQNWRANFAWKELESGGMEIAYRSPSPELSREIVLGTLQWLDSAFRGIAKQSGAIREAYFESRLKTQLRIVDSLQDSVAAFQIRNKLLTPMDQVESVARGAVDLEIQAEKMDLEIRSLMPSLGEQSSQVRQMVFARDQMRAAAKRILERETGGTLMKGLGSGVRSGILLQRMQKQLQVQVMIYSYLLQEKEQLSFDLTKDLPSLTIIDKPILPKKRTSPPRFLLFQAAIMFWVLLSCSWIVIADGLRRNPPSESTRLAWAHLVQALPRFLQRVLAP